MAVLHLLSRPGPRMGVAVAVAGAQRVVVLGVVVVVVVVVFGVGLALLGSVSSRNQAHTRSMGTPWIIPSIRLVLFVILVIIHGARCVPLRRGRDSKVTTPVWWTKSKTKCEGVRDVAAAA